MTRDESIASLFLSFNKFANLHEIEHYIRITYIPIMSRALMERNAEKSPLSRSRKSAKWQSLALIPSRSSRKSNRRLQTTRQPLCCRSHETNIFLQASRRGNSFSQTRAAFDIRMYATIPFSPVCKYRTDFTEIVAQIELQREPSLPSWP